MESSQKATGAGTRPPKKPRTENSSLSWVFAAQRWAVSSVSVSVAGKCVSKVGRSHSPVLRWQLALYQWQLSIEFPWPIRAQHLTSKWLSELMSCILAVRADGWVTFTRVSVSRKQVSSCLTCHQCHTRWHREPSSTWSHRQHFGQASHISHHKLYPTLQFSLTLTWLLCD